MFSNNTCLNQSVNSQPCFRLLLAIAQSALPNTQFLECAPRDVTKGMGTSPVPPTVTTLWPCCLLCPLWLPCSYHNQNVLNRSIHVGRKQKLQQQAVNTGLSMLFSGDIGFLFLSLLLILLYYFWFCFGRVVNQDLTDSMRELYLFCCRVMWPDPIRSWWDHHRACKQYKHGTCGIHSIEETKRRPGAHCTRTHACTRSLDPLYRHMHSENKGGGVTAGKTAPADERSRFFSSV